jgi:hypothetical protein
MPVTSTTINSYLKETCAMSYVGGKTSYHFYLYPKSRNEKELSNWRNHNLLLESNLGSNLLHTINDNETIF